jgi:hypothetical protein
MRVLMKLDLGIVYSLGFNFFKYVFALKFFISHLLLPYGSIQV